MNIKEMRIKRGLTQGQLAELSGIDQRQISRWELGKHRPSIDTVQKLAEILNCNISDLI